MHTHNFLRFSPFFVASQFFIEFYRMRVCGSDLHFTMHSLIPNSYSLVRSRQIVYHFANGPHNRTEFKMICCYLIFSTRQLSFDNLCGHKWFVGLTKLNTLKILFSNGANRFSIAKKNPQKVILRSWTNQNYWYLGFFLSTRIYKFLSSIHQKKKKTVLRWHSYNHRVKKGHIVLHKVRKIKFKLVKSGHIRK